VHALKPALIRVEAGLRSPMRRESPRDNLPVIDSSATGTGFRNHSPPNAQGPYPKERRWKAAETPTVAPAVPLGRGPTSECGGLGRRWDCHIAWLCGRSPSLESLHATDRRRSCPSDCASLPFSTPSTSTTSSGGCSIPKPLLVFHLTEITASTAANATVRDLPLAALNERVLRADRTPDC
jgi:hypothetical protein